MAEQVEFELSVLSGESGANTDRLTWPIRNSNSRYGSRKFCRWLGRIKSESEPPDSATEKNTGCSVYQAPNTASPVRMRERPTAKTPRNRANFSDCSRLCARSLCDSRLGGGASRIRTLSTPRRIENESEPPNLATEINATSCPLSARNSPSPVRIRMCPSPKTPRKRGSFWDGRA